MRLIERNKRILAPDRAGPGRRLEALRESGAAFDREVMAVLTNGQRLQYSDLKRQFSGTLWRRPRPLGGGL